MALIETQQVEPGRFICTPHPVLLDGQTNTTAELRPGESLYSFLARNVPDFHDDAWEVKVGGVLIPAEHWHRVKPKHGQMIEAHGAVKKQVLYIVALAALTYFTFGAGAAWIGAAGFTGFAATAVAVGVYAAGAIVINKVLGPKPPEVSQNQPDSVFSLGAARNRPRPYEPWPLLFGSVQVTPDLLSAPYSWHQGDDQYVGMVLNAGINVDRVDALSNGETLLSSYDEVEVYTAGMPGMPEQDIPLYSNADTTSGGELTWEGDWVQRTTSPDTVRIVVGLEYLLYDNDSKGRPYYNQETVVAEYRLVGSPTWLPFVTRAYRYNKPDTKRANLTKSVPRGQYEVRVHRLGRANDPKSGQKNGNSQFQWTTLTSVQYDATDYSGAARIGIGAKATGQLQGPMDEIRGVAHAKSMPIWDGTAWQTATTRENGLSNPGAQILQYARGFYAGATLQAGIGLDDEQIDIPALQAFMLHCTANGYTYDACIKGVRSHDEMLNAIALAGFGQITWAGGRLSVAWAADEQPLGGVVNMATIKRGQFQVDYTLANSADGIEYTYFDRTTWKPETLRVAAPGVTTMLSPATVTGEGVTTEAHAAELARYHLAQHLYQYKSISYSTDLEHLSYRRLTPLALQHDLTRWGHGGRVVAAVDNAGTVALTLDEPVPAPTSGNAYIGLRIPGEQVYRVFQIAAFTGDSDTITLAEPWPVDAALPGDASDNPAHDTIWIYDFKQTPGYRVRVVDIAPESGLKGASVAVVPEPPEFWTYVKTGEYTPPVTNPLLPKLPTATNLQVSESRTVQGDTVFTELTVNFDVTGGKMAYATVHAAYYVDHDAGYAELVEVAQTNTGTAKFRIGAAGTYAIVVRPYNADGVVGGVASTTYTTTGAEVAPPAFDYFTVTELDGGVRKYAFGYDGTTTPPPDYAGAEIRYITGSVPAPDWASMTPLGEDGFFTSAVEMVMPAAGLWTFAARPRTTSKLLGPLSIVTATLTENLGEITTQTGAEIAQIIQDQLADAQNLADEIIARQQTDAELAIAQAQLAVVQGQVGDILNADEWALANEYPSGDLVQNDGTLYRSLQAVPANTPITDVAYWEAIGNYASLGEAVSATAAQAQANTTEIAEIDGVLTAVSQTVSQHASRMPAGEGTLGTQAEITDLASTTATATSANSTKIANLSASIGQSVLLMNPDFELEESGWQADAFLLDNPNAPLPSNVDILRTAGELAHTGSCALRVAAPASAMATRVYNSNRFAVGPGEVVSGSIRFRSHYSSPPPAGTRVVWGVRWFTNANAHLADAFTTDVTADGVSNYFYPGSMLQVEVTAPANAAYARLYINVSAEFFGAPGPLYFDAALAGRGPRKADASALAVTNATVSNQGNTLTAHTDDILQLQSDIQGKASQTALNTLSQTVTDQGGDITGVQDALTLLDQQIGDVSQQSFDSLAQTVSNQGDQVSANQTAITGINTTIGQQSASITEVARIAASGVSGNAIINPSFESSANWGAAADGTGSLPANAVYVSGFGHSGSRALRFNSDASVSNSGLLAVTTGQQVRMGYWSRHAGSVPNGSVRLAVRGYDAAGAQQVFAFVPGSSRAGGGGFQSVFSITETLYTVPAGVTHIRLVPQATNLTSGAWLMDDVFMEPVNGTEAKFLASVTMTLDVNNYVTGWQLQNDGTTGEFAILADKFSVVSPSGGARFEWIDESLRVVDANGVMRVQIGLGF